MCDTLKVPYHEHDDMKWVRELIIDMANSREYMMLDFSVLKVA